MAAESLARRRKPLTRASAGLRARRDASAAAHARGEACFRGPRGARPRASVPGRAGRPRCTRRAQRPASGASQRASFQVSRGACRGARRARRRGASAHPRGSLTHHFSARAISGARGMSPRATETRVRRSTPTLDGNSNLPSPRRRSAAVHGRDDLFRNSFGFAVLVLNAHVERWRRPCFRHPNADHAFPRVR